MLCLTMDWIAIGFHYDLNQAKGLGTGSTRLSTRLMLYQLPSRTEKLQTVGKSAGKSAMPHHTETENQATLREFKQAVNMSAQELETWLKTEESQSVGMKPQEDGESTGHKSGRRTVEVIKKQNSDYTEDDFNHMRRVVSYVHRHLAQKPSSHIESSRWRYSLKNWGHDPLDDAN